jgi:uncharacterized membrane protein YgcG
MNVAVAFILGVVCTLAVIFVYEAIFTPYSPEKPSEPTEHQEHWEEVAKLTRKIERKQLEKQLAALEQEAGTK